MYDKISAAIYSKQIALGLLISKSKFHAHTDPLFKELKMLKLDSIIRFHICKFMSLYRHGLLPESFDNMFPRNNEIHSTVIILGRDLVFLYPVVGQILASFLYDSKDLNFSTL